MKTRIAKYVNQDRTAASDFPFTKQAKHTPGPWRVEIIGTFGYTVVGPAKEQSEANAHLIAAAPELLEACRRALIVLDMFVSSDRGEQEGSTRDIIVSAIAKAEGTAA
jgi:hypothetical protein